MNKKHFQVAIIGAGPAGSTCAIRLLQSGLKEVLLVESGDYEKFRIGESIPPETNILFHKMGIYHDFVAEAHDPCYGSCSYWGSEYRGYNDFLLNPNGHGWHLDRTRFNQYLAKEAVKRGAVLRTNTRFLQSEKLEKGGYAIKLKINKKEVTTVTANVIVDASGARAVFATEQGSHKIERLPLVCLGIRFKLGAKRQKISKLTHLEAVEYGWWYAARIPNERLLVALYTDAATLKSKGIHKMETWLEHLNNSPNTQKLTAGLEQADERPKGFPAPSFLLDKVVGENWLAIGDAASAFDPITAQGIIKAMMNAFSAAEVIIKKLEGKANDFSLFEQEVNERYKQYTEMRSYFYQMEKRWEGSSFWKKVQ